VKAAKGTERKTVAVRFGPKNSKRDQKEGVNKGAKKPPGKKQ